MNLTANSPRRGGLVKELSFCLCANKFSKFLPKEGWTVMGQFMLSYMR